MSFSCSSSAFFASSAVSLAFSARISASFCGSEERTCLPLACLGGACWAWTCLPLACWTCWTLRSLQTPAWFLPHVTHNTRVVSASSSALAGLRPQSDVLWVSAALRSFRFSCKAQWEHHLPPRTAGGAPCLPPLRTAGVATCLPPLRTAGLAAAATLASSWCASQGMT